MEGYDKSTMMAQEVDRMPGAMERLDLELERFEKDLSALAVKIGPVSTQYATADVLSAPRPEPETQLHGRVERLALLLSQLGEFGEIGLEAPQ